MSHRVAKSLMTPVCVRADETERENASPCDMRHGGQSPTADPTLIALERKIAALQERVARIEAARPTTSADPFFVTKVAAPMLGMEYDTARKHVRKYGERLNGDTGPWGFRQSYIDVYRQSRRSQILPISSHDKAGRGG